MIETLFDITKWYIILQITGIIGFLLCFNLFSGLKLRGFCISKTTGLFIISIIAWFLCNKKLELIPYSTLTLYLIFLSAGIFSYIIYQKNKPDIDNFLKENYKYLLSIEIAFLISFLIFVLLRTYTPNIEGTEKPLEFVVINSILRGDYMPPVDAWLSGHVLNYYYMGQFVFCNIIKLTFINPSIGFNLIAPTVLSLILIGSFGFIYQLTRSIPWGVLAAFMTGLMGNLEPAVQIIKNGWNPDTFRWWDAGHIIPQSFPEFPYWSFLHADVHAHFLVHPFTIMFLFVLLAFIYNNYFLIRPLDFRSNKKFSANIFYCLLLGSFMLINSWNYPSAIALTLAGLYIQLAKTKPEKSTISIILRVLPSGIFYILTSYILYLAFYAYYTSPVEGLGIVNPAHRTTTGQFLMLIGTFLLPLLIIAIIEFINNLIKNKNINLKRKTFALLIILTIITATIFATKSFVIALSTALWLFLLAKILSRKEKTEYLLISSITFLVFSLILVCELIFVNDLFGLDYERQNTVAKSYIQILLLLPLSVSYFMYVISSRNYLKSTLKIIYIVTISILIILSSIFLFTGTYVKNHQFKYVYAEQNWHIPTLNGSKFIEVKYDGEYEAIMWLRKNATKDDVILEAIGAPYSYYGRVASQTGIPALLNWAGSLNVLRGKYFYLISNPRENAVKRIYKTKNKKKIHQLLSKYNISYIYIGPLEREEFTEKELKGFEKETTIFEKAFKKGNTVIYRVKRP